MRILFIADNFPPEVNAPATRTFEHCKEWIKLGADITVITCAPNFPQGKVYSGYRNKIYSREKMDGIKVIRVWTYISRNEGFLKRTLDYLSFGVSSFITGLFLKTDIIVATSPQFFTTWAAFGLSEIKRVPWVFELRDLWPESIKSVGAMSGDKIIHLLEKIELFLYRKAKMVIAVTEAFKRNLVSRRIEGQKIRVVTNGSNFDLFKPREKDPDLLEKLSLNGKFVIGYIGTHGMAHGLEFIVDAIRDVTDYNLHLLFIGDGAKKREVMRRAEMIGLKNMTFLDPVAKEEVPRYLSIIDVMLVPLKKSETFKTVIPSKIFEAAAMQKPILLGVEGQAQEIVEEYDAGICFKPENKEDFLDKIIQLKNDCLMYQKLQNGCRRLAADYDRRQLAKKMYLYLQEAAEKIK